MSINLRPELKLTVEQVEKNVTFPNVGQLMKIESLKQTLSRDKYNQLADSRLAQAAFALDIIDMLSTFMVLIPELFTATNIKNYEDLDLSTAKRLVDIYNESYVPWYNDIFGKLFPKKEPKKDTEA